MDMVISMDIVTILLMNDDGGRNIMVVVVSCASLNICIAVLLRHVTGSNPSIHRVPEHSFPRLQHDANLPCWSLSE
jgi:hypothetical protein